MKKTILIILVALLLNGCRYVNTTEKYVDARVSPELTIPEGTDKPNTTSTLSVPTIADKTNSSIPNRAPPDMPIRIKQTDDGKLKIENRNGFALLTADLPKETVWAMMQKLEIENWKNSGESEDTCSVLLTYADIDAQDRENAGFIKKVFTRNNLYTDYSGIYKLACTEKGSVVEILFSKQDGSVAKSFLADNVMNNLYNLFK